MRPSDRDRLTQQITHDAAILGHRLPLTMARVAEWASGLGYPTGGSTRARGGDSTPLPERLVTAADGRALDACHADLAEADAILAMVADGLRWLSAFVARNTPTRRNPDDRPTATCGNQLAANELLRGCGRTIAATAEDPVRRGLCAECFYRWRDSHRRAVDVGETYHA